MDVRCEKCQTEYELDESKLKPGGVTVKCTTCGHMFKVRGRPPSARSASATPVPRASSSSGRIDRSTPTPPGGSRASSVLMDAEDGERTWLIRLEDGEIKTCRELSTLQKWIVSGRVSRSCAISRTGKKWKLLGEIGELASFFAIADEARDARSPSSQWSAQTREYPATPDPDGAPESSAHTVPRAASEEPSAPLHLASEEVAAPAEQTPQPSYADALAAELQLVDDGARAGSSAPGAFSRTLPLGGASLPPRAASGAERRGQDAMQIPAQSPPDGYDLPIDPDDSDGEEATAARARSQVLGDAPTLPTYGAGQLDGPGASAASSASSASARAAVPGLPLAPPPSRAASAPAGPATAGWASRGQVGAIRDHGPSGPTGGLKHGGPVSEAAFVGGAKAPNVRGEFDNGRFRAAPFSPSSFTDDEPLIPPRSRAGLWVILFSLIVMAGAAAAVYLILFTGAEEEGPDEPIVVMADAAAVTPPTTAPPTTAPPTTAPPPPTATAEMDRLAREAEAALLADSQATLEPLAQKLAAFASGAETAVNPAFLVARGRVEMALAQQLLDRAKLAPAAEAKKLVSQARAQAKGAHKLADQALALEADNPGAVLLMADARRIEGERSVEVERWIKRARQNPAGAALAGEADLVLALLRVRDDRLRDARGMLDKLVNSTKGDVRPLFRLAWIEYLYGHSAEARRGAETVLKAQPDHATARALLEKLGGGEAAPVETADPMPPEDKPDDKPDDKVAGGKPGDGKPGDGKPGDGKPGEGGEPPASGGRDSFDAILARADKLAENGNCAGAMPLYRKVLDMHPASVEALTGLAYCHLDRREFASAYARFRAALGISSRYQPAMWGIAEAYQQQGLKQQALERFEAFLREHPSSQRSSAARLRIDHLKRELGAGTPGSEPGTGSDSGETGTGETPPASTEGGESPSSGSSSGESPAGSGGQESPVQP